MRPLVKNILLLLAILLVGINLGHAQTAILRGLTIKDGLSGSIIYNMYKDGRGFVWIASDKGVDRFDGYHLSPCEGLRGTAVKVLAGMPDNAVLAGNEAGLWQYDTKSGCFSPVFRSQVQGEVTSLVTDSRGLICTGTSKGLFIREQGKWRHILIDRNSLSRKNHVLGLSPGEGNVLWVAGESGVYAVDRKTGQVRTVLQGAPRSFNTLVCLGKKVYIGTRNKGLLCYDTVTGKVAPFGAIGSFSVRALSGDAAKQLLYVGTDGGGVFFLSLADGRIVKALKSEAGIENTLRSNSVYSLLVDREGILWVGYFQMGLDYTLYQNHFFSLYNYLPAFNSYHLPVRAIAIHGRQRVIGSRDGLYFIDEARGIVQRYTMPRLKSDMIFCILYYKGAYLIGTAAGLYRLNPADGALSTYRLPGIEDNEELFFSLVEGRDGSLWAGATSGLYRYREGGQPVHFQSSNSQLPDNIIYNLYEDREERLWIMTSNGGASLYEPSTQAIHTDLFPAGFPAGSVRNVIESISGQFYFITKQGTLLTSSPDLKATKRFLPELFSDGKKCVFLTEDSRQGLWIGTDRGLFCYDRRGFIHTYTFRDGLPDPTFFSCLPVKEEDGTIWFGNAQGLLHWTGRYTSGKMPYPIRVTDVLVNNQSLGKEAFDRDGIRLSSSKEELTFHISDMSYTDPSSVAYEYRLEGQDSRWMPLKGSSDITYYNLSSGFYTLKIRLEGVPASEVAIPVSVGISWWLIVLGVCVFGVIVARIVCFRLKRPLRFKWAGLLGRRQKVTVPVQDKYRNNKVEKENCFLLEQKLEHLMREKKMYLNPELKLKDLAGLLGVPVYNLSYVLNIYMHQRFNDYVNNYRVAEFKALVTEARYRLYTLDALSSLCGFSSKTSFFRNFKRVEGLTPSEYIKRLDNGGEKV